MSFRGNRKHVFRLLHGLVLATSLSISLALTGCGDPKQSFSQRLPANAPAPTGQPIVTTDENRNRCEAATVPFGQTCNCESQTRSCTGGNCTPWTGHGDAWAALTCSVQAPVSCVDDNGSLVPHGDSQSRITYPSNSVPVGSTCSPTGQTRSCNNGTWSPWAPLSGTNSPTCTENRNRCEAATVPYGQTCNCESQFNICTGGTCSGFSGHGDSWSAGSCSVGSPANCTDENGNAVPHGGSQGRSAYNSSNPPLGQACVAVPETRSCSNGTLSPWNPSSPTNLSCTETRERCETSSVPFGQTCNCETQDRSCSGGNCGGSWSGHGDGWSATACSVGAAQNCSDSEGSANSGDTSTRQRYKKKVVSSGQSCESESQSRSCSNGAFSPWSPTNFSELSCSVCAAGSVPDTNSNSCVSCATLDPSKPAWDSVAQQCVSCLSLDPTKPIWNGSACVSCATVDSSKPIWDSTQEVCKSCDGAGAFGQAIALPKPDNSDCKCQNNAVDPWVMGTGDNICRDCPLVMPNFNTSTGACENACNGGKVWTGTSCACPAGQQWFSGINHCAVPNTCSNGFTLNNSTNACVCVAPLQKFTRGGTDYCEAPVACDTANGFDYNNVTNQCSCALPKEQIIKNSVLVCEQMFCKDQFGNAGNGSSGNPYLVCDSKSLDNVRYRTGNYFKQIANIDLLNDSQKKFSCDPALQATQPMFLPITVPNSSIDFIAYAYDGQNYSISNYCYDSATDPSAATRRDIALFPRLQRSNLQNIILKNLSMKVDNSGGTTRVGSLTSVASNFSTIRNIQVSGTISGRVLSNTAFLFAGGLAYSVGPSVESATAKTLQNITANVSVDLQDLTGTCKAGSRYTGGAQYLTEAAGVVSEYFDQMLDKSMQNIVMGATRTPAQAQSFNLATLTPTPVTVSACVSSGIVGHAADAYFADLAAYARLISSAHSTHGWSGGADGTGGIVGIAYESDIKNAHSFVDIDARGIENVGGIAGHVSTLNRGGVGIVDSTVDPLFAGAMIRGCSYVGGLEGNARSHFIRRSRAKIPVSAYPDTYAGSFAGGLAGVYSGSELTQVYATGNVRIENTAPNLSFSMGALAGVATGAIRQAYATGNLSYAMNPAAQSRIGGLIGYLQGVATTNMQFAHYRPSAAIQLGGNTLRGGLVGQRDPQPAVTNSYWDAQGSGQATDPVCVNDPFCLGLTTNQMRMQNSFAGWAFPATWLMLQNANHPTLVDPAP